MGGLRALPRSDVSWRAPRRAVGQAWPPCAGGSALCHGKPQEVGGAAQFGSRSEHWPLAHVDSKHPRKRSPVLTSKCTLPQRGPPESACFTGLFFRAGGTGARFFTFGGFTHVLRADALPAGLRGVKEDSYGSALGAGLCTASPRPPPCGNFCLPSVRPILGPLAEKGCGKSCRVSRWTADASSGSPYRSPPPLLARLRVAGPRASRGGERCGRPAGRCRRSLVSPGGGSGSSYPPIPRVGAVGRNRGPSTVAPGM